MDLTKLWKQSYKLSISTFIFRDLSTAHSGFDVIFPYIPNVICGCVEATLTRETQSANVFELYQMFSFWKFLPKSTCTIVIKWRTIVSQAADLSDHFCYWRCQGNIPHSIRRKLAESSNTRQNWSILWYCLHLILAVQSKHRIRNWNICPDFSFSMFYCTISWFLAKCKFILSLLLSKRFCPFDDNLRLLLTWFKIRCPLLSHIVRVSPF